MRNPRQTGLTLTELAVAITIVGVLATLVAPRVAAFLVHARRGEAKVNLEHIRTLQAIYKVEHGSAYQLANAVGHLGKDDSTGSGCSTDPGGHLLNDLGFRPQGCEQLRYRYYTTGNTSVSSEHFYWAFGHSDKRGKWIYPDCEGAGAVELCDKTSPKWATGDLIRVTQGSPVESCRNIIKYCPDGTPGPIPPDPEPPILCGTKPTSETCPASTPNWNSSKQVASEADRTAANCCYCPSPPCTSTPPDPMCATPPAGITRCTTFKTGQENTVIPSTISQNDYDTTCCDSPDTPECTEPKSAGTPPNCSCPNTAPDNYRCPNDWESWGGNDEDCCECKSGVTYKIGDETRCCGNFQAFTNDNQCSDHPYVSSDPKNATCWCCNSKKDDCNSPNKWKLGNAPNCCTEGPQTCSSLKKANPPSPCPTDKVYDNDKDNDLIPADGDFATFCCQDACDAVNGTKITMGSDTVCCTQFVPSGITSCNNGTWSSEILMDGNGQLAGIKCTCTTEPICNCSPARTCAVGYENWDTGATCPRNDPREECCTAIPTKKCLDRMYTVGTSSEKSQCEAIPGARWTTSTTQNYRSDVLLGDCCLLPSCNNVTCNRPRIKQNPLPQTPPFNEARCCKCPDSEPENACPEEEPICSKLPPSKEIEGIRRDRDLIKDNNTYTAGNEDSCYCPEGNPKWDKDEGDNGGCVSSPTDCNAFVAIMSSTSTVGEFCQTKPHGGGPAWTEKSKSKLDNIIENITANNFKNQCCQVTCDSYFNYKQNNKLKVDESHVCVEAAGGVANWEWANNGEASLDPADNENFKTTCCQNTQDYCRNYKQGDEDYENCQDPDNRAYGSWIKTGDTLRNASDGTNYGGCCLCETTTGKSSCSPPNNDMKFPKPMWSPYPGCVCTCPGDTEWNSGAGKCECKEPRTVFVNPDRCECPNGKAYNSVTKACETSRYTCESPPNGYSCLNTYLIPDNKKTTSISASISETEYRRTCCKPNCLDWFAQGPASGSGSGSGNGGNTGGGGSGSGMGSGGGGSNRGGGGSGSGSGSGNGGNTGDDGDSGGGIPVGSGSGSGGSGSIKNPPSEGGDGSGSGSGGYDTDQNPPGTNFFGNLFNRFFGYSTSGNDAICRSHGYSNAKGSPSSILATNGAANCCEQDSGVSYTCGSPPSGRSCQTNYLVPSSTSTTSISATINQGTYRSTCCRPSCSNWFAQNPISGSGSGGAGSGGSGNGGNTGGGSGSGSGSGNGGNTGDDGASGGGIPVGSGSGSGGSGSIKNPPSEGGDGSGSGSGGYDTDQNPPGTNFFGNLFNRFFGYSTSGNDAICRHHGYGDAKGSPSSILATGASDCCERLVSGGSGSGSGGGSTTGGGSGSGSGNGGNTGGGGSGSGSGSGNGGNTGDDGDSGGSTPVGSGSGSGGSGVIKTPPQDGEDDGSGSGGSGEEYDTDKDPPLGKFLGKLFGKFSKLLGKLPKLFDETNDTACPSGLIKNPYWQAGSKRFSRCCVEDKKNKGRCHLSSPCSCDHTDPSKPDTCSDPSKTWKTSAPCNLTDKTDREANCCK